MQISHEQLRRLASRPSLMLTLIAATTLAALPAIAQQLEGRPANPKYEYSTPMPSGVAVPDEVKTRLGTLHFDGGVPDQATTDKIYDNLDFQRAVQAYLLAADRSFKLLSRTTDTSHSAK